MKETETFQADSLNVRIYESDPEMGKAAARFVSGKLAAAIQEKGSANLILATGASQFSFLENLQQEQAVEWSRITVFHLDEYYGLSDQHPASFRKYLKERILDIVKPFRVHLIEGDATDISTEVTRYQSLLESHPVDIACIGIGENGHIAFNDPPVADFNDSRLIKVVDLDEACRQQQLGEGWFRSLEEIPKQALTLTIPAIMSCKAISCVVPDQRKAKAVNDAIRGPVATSCPASILRKHSNATLFLDKEAASLIGG